MPSSLQVSGVCEASNCRGMKDFWISIFSPLNDSARFGSLRFGDGRPYSRHPVGHPEKLTISIVATFFRKPIFQIPQKKLFYIVAHFFARQTFGTFLLLNKDHPLRFWFVTKC